MCGRVPDSFCETYTVPIPKSSDSVNMLRSAADFRGIVISNLFSKLFESCLLDIFGSWFFTEENQFGFKKGVGCSHAIYCANYFASKLSDGGDTVNILALDIAKAFPSVNRHALLIKLIKRNCPVSFIDLIGEWLARSQSCVKWAGSFSDKYFLRTGVNQGSVLAPILFALVIDDLIRVCNDTDWGIILVYADDILILTKTRRNLQDLFGLVQLELDWLNLRLNLDKCCSMRVGPRHGVMCEPIYSLNGTPVPMVKELKYLGVYIVAGFRMRCSVEYAKRAFLRQLMQYLVMFFM